MERELKQVIASHSEINSVDWKDQPIPVLPEHRKTQSQVAQSLREYQKKEREPAPEPPK